MLSRQEAASQLVYWSRQMIAKGLAWGNAGNASIRVGADRFLVTASGSSLGNLTESDLVEVSLDGKVIGSSGRRPSKEAPMHAAIYSERPDINAVAHAHPFYSLIIACSSEEIPRNWFVENMYYLERTARVEYYHPGSKELAEGVRRAARKANLLILNNHGILAYDVNFQEALMGLESFELASKMYVVCRGAGIPIPGLPAETVGEFLEKSAYKPRREWPEK